MPEFVEVELLNGDKRPAIVVKTDGDWHECVVFLAQGDEPISGLDGVSSLTPRVLVKRIPRPLDTPEEKTEKSAPKK